MALGSINKVDLSNIAAINKVNIANAAAFNYVDIVTTAGDSISLDYTWGQWDGTGSLLDGNDYIQVTSSGAWTSSIQYDSGAGWISRTPSFGSTGANVTIDCTGGYEEAGRTGTVTFTRLTANVLFYVEQLGVI